MQGFKTIKRSLHSEELHFHFYSQTQNRFLDPTPNQVRVVTVVNLCYSVVQIGLIASGFKSKFLGVNYKALAELSRY
jgi:hypothetical protein